MKTITYNHETHRLVPVERSYDTRAKQIIAFNTEKGDLDDKLEAANKAMLSAAPQPEPVVIGSPLTERKAQSVIDRGYKITGYTLTNEQGRKCIVDMSAVRWFDDGDKFFRIMHPQPEPVEVEPVAYYTDQGGWPRICLAVDGNHDGYETPLYTAPPDYEEIKRQRDELAAAHKELDLRAGKVLVEELSKNNERIKDLEKQRDELVHVLEKAREEMSCANFNSAAERIDHALASVKCGA